MSYLVINTCSMFVLFVFSQIWEDADVAKLVLLPHFSSSLWRQNNPMAKSLLFFFVLQLTALKSRLFLDLDSSLHQVTQHSAPISPSILVRPTQLILPSFLSVLDAPQTAGVMSFTAFTHPTCNFCGAFSFPKAYFPPCSNLSHSPVFSNLFSPLVNRTLSACWCRFSRMARCG